jgi:hypothetical protein
MSAGIPELLLLSVSAASAFAAALFSVLCFVRTRIPIPALTQETAAPILRSETEIVRTAVQDQARWLRQELGQSLTSFQELMLTTFGTVRDGIDGQVRGFGERLDGGVRAIDERAAGIAAKLNDDMAQMRSEANTNREQLRAILESTLLASSSRLAACAPIEWGLRRKIDCPVARPLLYSRRPSCSCLCRRTRSYTSPCPIFRPPLDASGRNHRHACPRAARGELL